MCVLVLNSVVMTGVAQDLFKFNACNRKNNKISRESAKRTCDSDWLDGQMEFLVFPLFFVFLSLSVSALSFLPPSSPLQFNFSEIGRKFLRFTNLGLMRDVKRSMHS